MSFKYYSGFCLNEERDLFDDYLIINDLSRAGFSFGAIKAFEEVLQNNQRIDTLQLFSPAFFQDKNNKYKRMQLMFFKKDATAYCSNFLNNIALPSSQDMSDYFTQGTYEELETLLSYEWSTEKLQSLVDRNIHIEVYLGSKDEIIDAKAAQSFFKDYATVYYIKNVGHILKD